MHGEVLTERTGDVWVVTLRGEHDLATSETVREELVALLDHGTTIIVDLSETTFMDSSIMGALLHAAKHATQDPGDRVLIALPPVKSAVHRLFQLLKAEQYFELYTDRNAALESAAKRHHQPR